MFRKPAPATVFCSISALAVIGTGTLWLSAGSASRIERQRPRVVLAPPAPQTLPAALPRMELPPPPSAPPTTAPDPSPPSDPATPSVPPPTAAPTTEPGPSPEQPPAEKRFQPERPLTQAESIASGRELFLHEWTPNDPLAQGDGLGPMFNATSCATCHAVGGLGGAGQNRDNVTTFLIIPGHSIPVADGAIHSHSVNDRWTESVHDARAFLEHIDPIYRDALRRGRTTIVPGKFVSTVVNPPALWGLGLIDQIPPAELCKPPENLNASAHSWACGGRMRRHVGGGLGKFGWKGQFASLRDFVAGACAGELGLGNAIRKQQVPGEYRDDIDAPQDLTIAQVRAITEFIASLPAPRQVLPGDPGERKQVSLGRQTFDAVGCTDCHKPDVGAAQGIYSDLRLHDVIDTQQRSQEPSYSTAIGDVLFPSDYPAPTEWRTPPLWGVADTAPYWHDGSAATLADAIGKHGWEAQDCMSKYQQLDSNKRDALLAFLNTLKAPEGLNPPTDQPPASQ